MKCKNTAFFAVGNQPQEFLALFYRGSGDALVYVNAVFDTRGNPNKQGLSAVLLRRKPSFFMPVFSFSATLPVKI